MNFCYEDDIHIFFSLHIVGVSSRVNIMRHCEQSNAQGKVAVETRSSPNRSSVDRGCTNPSTRGGEGDEETPRITEYPQHSNKNRAQFETIHISPVLRSGIYDWTD